MGSERVGSSGREAGSGGSSRQRFVVCAAAVPTSREETPGAGRGQPRPTGAKGVEMRAASHTHTHNVENGQETTINSQL